jgi:hypothetical protein
MLASAALEWPSPVELIGSRQKPTRTNSKTDRLIEKFRPQLVKMAQSGRLVLLPVGVHMARRLAR